MPMTIFWSPPIAGTLKLNVDGSTIGNPGLAGGGGLIRRPDGSLITSFVNAFGIKNNLEAEILSLIVGLKLCLAKGWKDVWVEMDSLTVYQIICGSSHIP
ncbi:hypothetical protein ACH5RR_003391 [Cinchona calisaya]|uniref:RNase H type-1 domain-containing protein n=1 Tax=Cinchona calisaya TaxID=153742 RepID=A0ABD3AUR5_9GENT